MHPLHFYTFSIQNPSKTGQKDDSEASSSLLRVVRINPVMFITTMHSLMCPGVILKTTVTLGLSATRRCRPANESILVSFSPLEQM